MELAESTAPDREVLYRIAQTACGDHNLSEDAAAESISKALIKTRLRKTVNLPWYRTVIKNHIRDDYRKKQRLRQAPAATLTGPRKLVQAL